MIDHERVLVMDLDGTLCHEKREGQGYADVEPRAEVIARLREYRTKGFRIIIHTARNMRTHDGDIDKINKLTLPVILEWLNKHNIPFDSVQIGKPWQGKGGFYVDDKAIRPEEFVKLPYETIRGLVGERDTAGQ